MGIWVNGLCGGIVVCECAEYLVQQECTTRVSSESKSSIVEMRVGSWESKSATRPMTP